MLHMKIKSYTQYFEDKSHLNESADINYNNLLYNAIEYNDVDEVNNVLETISTNEILITSEHWLEHIIHAMEKPDLKCLDAIIDDLSYVTSLIISCKMLMSEKYRDKIKLLFTKYSHFGVRPDSIFSFLISPNSNNDFNLHIDKNHATSFYNALMFLFKHNAKLPIQSLKLFKDIYNSKYYKKFIEIFEKAVRDYFKDDNAKLIEFFNGINIFPYTTTEFKNDYEYLFEIQQYQTNESSKYSKLSNDFWDDNFISLFEEAIKTDDEVELEDICTNDSGGWADETLWNLLSKTIDAKAFKCLWYFVETYLDTITFINYIFNDIRTNNHLYTDKLINFFLTKDKNFVEYVFSFLTFEPNDDINLKNKILTYFYYKGVKANIYYAKCISEYGFWEKLRALEFFIKHLTHFFNDNPTDIVKFIKTVCRNDNQVVDLMLKKLPKDFTEEYQHFFEIDLYS